MSPRSIRFHELVVETSPNQIWLAQSRALRSVLCPRLEPNNTVDVARRLTRSHTMPLLAISARDGDGDKAGEGVQNRIAEVCAKAFSEADAQHVARSAAPAAQNTKSPKRGR